MADSIRESILKALEARAQVLLPVATRDRTSVPEAALPRLVLTDGIERKAEPSSYGEQTFLLSVSVDYADAVIDGLSPSTQANDRLAQLTKALIGTDPTLGGLAELVDLEGNLIVYPPQGETALGIKAEFSVRYRTRLGDPYSQ